MLRIDPYLCYTGILKEKLYANAREADDEHIARHKNRLASVLESFELRCLGVSEDGDCLFTSVAMH